MLQPLAKRIIVEPILKEKKEGLLILKDESPTKYKVIAIGDEVTKVALNDIVLIEYSRPLKYEDISYTIVTEENVIAKYRE